MQCTKDVYPPKLNFNKNMSDIPRASVHGVMLKSPILHEQRQLGHAWFEGYVPEKENIAWDMKGIIGTYKGFFFKKLLMPSDCEKSTFCITISTGRVNDHLPVGIFTNQTSIAGGCAAFGWITLDDPNLKIRYRAEPFRQP